MSIDPTDRTITEAVKKPVGVEATPATRHRWTWGLVLALVALALLVILR